MKTTIKNGVTVVSKREVFTTLLEKLPEISSLSKEDKDLISEKLKTELENLKKKSTTPRKISEEQEKAREELQNKIKKALTEEPQDVAAIRKAIGDPDLSSSRITSTLLKMEGITINKLKGKNFYCL